MLKSGDEKLGRGPENELELRSSVSRDFHESDFMELLEVNEKLYEERERYDKSLNFDSFSNSK